MNKTLMIGLTPPLEGGSERHIYEMSSRLDNVSVLTQKGTICKNKVELPVIKKPALLRNLSFLISSFIYSIFLTLTLKRRYDVIHIHENLLYFLVPLLKLRYKVVVTVHGIKGFKFFDNKKLWFFFKQGLRCADTLIAVNIEDKNSLSKYFRHVTYIPNGVDLSLYSKINIKVVKKITFIGRLHEQKGIIYLLEAFSDIKEKIPGYNLEIIGKVDEYGKSLQRKFSDKRIIWRGFLSNRVEIVKSLKSAYCIALPSLWEGLPLTLFEALATGRPVLVSDIPAFKSVLKDEAIFFKVKDKNSLSKAILSVIKSKKESDSYGKKGKILSGRYDWGKLAEQLNEVYDG